MSETRSPPSAASASPTSASCSRKPKSGVSGVPSSSSGEAAASAADRSGLSPGSSSAVGLPSAPGASEGLEADCEATPGVGVAAALSPAAPRASAHIPSNSLAAPTSSYRFSSRSSPSSPSSLSLSSYPVSLMTSSIASAAPGAFRTASPRRRSRSRNGPSLLRADAASSGSRSIDSMASHRESPVRPAESRSRSMVVSPIPRGGMLTMRSRSTSERGFTHKRR